MARRQLADFIDAYVAYTDQTEPMQSFHIWCAISAIAGALERKVYVKLGHQKIFPNFYTVLCGPAGWARKGTAIDLIRPIMEGAGIRLMSGAITMERLSQRLKAAIENYADPTEGLVKFHCSVTFLSPELQVFLREKNVDLLGRLTDLYDCPDPWIYDTKNQGTDYVQGAYFNLLAATAPDWIASMLPDPAIGGGFTRRIIWVVEEDKRTIPRPYIDENLQEILIKDLEAIGLLAGAAEFTDELWKIYEKWYHEHDAAFRRGELAVRDPRFSSYCGTRATILRKLSLIVSVSESSSLIIEPRHWYRAKEILEHTERRMPRAFQSMGQARYADAVQMVFNFLCRRKRVQKAEILRWFFRDIDEGVYNIVVNTLLRMETIQVRNIEGTEYLELKEGAENVLDFR
ncbi:MAG: hypothetical protein GF383_16905 [Candidatus Lokiarchaeota archaeon]|nr:hypothetical protein [Candidatus Lokiarchaeota archaeon]